MRIFQLHNTPYSGNPYIGTLMDGLTALNYDVKFGYGEKIFWSDMLFEYNIVHIHWPDAFLKVESELELTKFKERLIEVKNHGMKIIVTCHNMLPHYCKSSIRRGAYQLAYTLADAMIHLGSWSLEQMQKEYPMAHHFLIPHHTYDMLYKKTDRNKSLRALRLNKWKKYILCFGAFRDDEERILVDGIISHFYKKGIEVLAPHYYEITWRRNLLVVLKQWCKCKLKELKCPGLHIYGWHVSDKQLPYFFGVAEVCLIQRKNILNSGNLSMAFLMGNVVVGPSVGNVGKILKECGNPTFNPDSIDSLYDAIDEAFFLKSKGKGIENSIYAKQYFSTEVVCRQLYNAYKQLM